MALSQEDVVVRVRTLSGTAQLGLGVCRPVDIVDVRNFFHHCHFVDRARLELGIRVNKTGGLTNTPVLYPRSNARSSNTWHTVPSTRVYIKLRSPEDKRKRIPPYLLTQVPVPEPPFFPSLQPGLSLRRPGPQALAWSPT